ncbi:MAG: hypothetical protein AB1505_06820 [Candidatus Latescibacterota bacterium]
MRPDEMLARRLAAEIETELGYLRRLGQERREAPTSTDTFSLRSRASILHDFYTGAERVFVRIAEELNGGVPRGEQWHRQLLRDMALELPEVRPPVVTADLAAALGEYLRFRHLFRNVYGFALDAERMRLLEERFDGVLGQLIAQVQSFGAWMLGHDSA